MEKKGRSNKAKTEAEILLMKEIPNNQLNMKNFPFFIGFHNSYNRWLALVFLNHQRSQYLRSQYPAEVPRPSMPVPGFQVFLSNDDPPTTGDLGDLVRIRVDVTHGCQPKNRGFSPKMDGENNGKPY